MEKVGLVANRTKCESSVSVALNRPIVQLFALLSASICIDGVTLKATARFGLWLVVVKLLATAGSG